MDLAVRKNAAGPLALPFHGFGPKLWHGRWAALPRRREKSMVTSLRHHDETEDELALRAQIDAIINAVRGKDVDALLSCCAPEIATFDLVPPLKHEGAEAIRELWQRMLASFVPPLNYDVYDLELMVGSDVAFTRSLNRFGGTTSEGQRVTRWLCSTLGFRKVHGRWKLVHQHFSVPLDIVSGQALFELAPGASGAPA
jgi:ketosteroid isomerase-like protein